MSKRLTGRVARLNDVLCAVNLLNWDARVMMPGDGHETRGHQIATLMGLARGMITDPAMGEAAEAAFESAQSELERRAARAVLEARAHHLRIPADLLERQARMSASAGAAWAEARAKSDFSIFLPFLRDIVALAREKAEALGYGAHPYDAMVDIFEPGETAASVGARLNELRSGIAPILDTALGRPPPRSDFLYRDFPVEGQKAFCERIAADLGYDRARGRLDTAVHPFEISFTRQDVRITSRWHGTYLPMAIFGTIHETGHALYEMGVAPEFTRGPFATDMIGLYAVGGTSFGMHESQSRLLENHVGRTPAFWARHFPALRDAFPDQLRDVEQGEFVAAANRVEPGLIRVEADELTYDLHVMIRVRVEMALMDGALAVEDVPDAWNAAVRQDLGVEVPDDARGCLQDVHWSHGYIGSFPTYTIGNVTAAQVMAAARRSAPELGAALSAGRTHPLRRFLEDRIWRHGRSRTRAELLEGLGQSANDSSDYVTHLEARFGGT